MREEKAKRRRDREKRKEEEPIYSQYSINSSHCTGMLGAEQQKRKTERDERARETEEKKDRIGQDRRQYSKEG